MHDLIFITGILLIFIIIYLLIPKVKDYKENQDELARLQKEISEHKKDLDTKRANLQKISEEISSKKYFNENLQKIREDEIDRLLGAYQENEKEKILREIEEWTKSAQEAATEEFDCYEILIDGFKDQVNEVRAELEDYKVKRDVINQEISRNRAILEKKEFYSIQLNSNTVADLNFLEKVREQIFYREKFDKLVYDNYIHSHAKALVKRLTSGRKICGIYKVTNTTTNEVYIGKSVSIGDRIVTHIKAVYRQGTIGSPQLTAAIQKYGISSFTWEILEEVDRETLSEREKFYIEFYDTVNYGYNMRVG